MSSCFRFSNLVSTTRTGRGTLPRLTGLFFALVTLMAGLMVVSETPVLAATYSYSFNPGGAGNTPAGGTLDEATRFPGNRGCIGPGPRAGYTMQGWRSSHDGQIYGTLCSEWYFNLTDFIMPAQNVVFTAVWGLTITYDSRGGSTVVDGDTSTTNGASITTLPTIPVRSGYVFSGWFTSTNGGTQITAGSPHGQTSNFTLYARWTGNPLVVTYDSQGGSAVVNGDISTEVGGLINPLPSIPSRSGFTFDSWNTAANGSGVNLGVVVPVISDGIAHGQVSDFVVYAQWIGNALNITYDTQGGGTVVDGDVTTASGSTITTLPTNPVLSGYTFNGWYTSSSGGTQVTSSAPHGQINDFTLYAQWSQISVPVATPPQSVVTPVSPTVAPSSLQVILGGAALNVQHQSERIMTDLITSPGKTVSITGSNYQSATEVEVWVNSTRVLLGKTLVSVDNAFQFTGKFPKDIESGRHTLEIIGVGLSGNNQTTLVSITIEAPAVTASSKAQLPDTGAQISGILLLAMAMFTSGYAMNMLSRRRQFASRD